MNPISIHLRRSLNGCPQSRTIPDAMKSMRYNKTISLNLSPSNLLKTHRIEHNERTRPAHPIQLDSQHDPIIFLCRAWPRDENRFGWSAFRTSVLLNCLLRVRWTSEKGVQVDLDHAVP